MSPENRELTSKEHLDGLAAALVANGLRAASAWSLATAINTWKNAPGVPASIRIDLPSDPEGMPEVHCVINDRDAHAPVKRNK